MDQQNFDVMIAGGAMAGLSMALALAPSGLRIALVEKQPFKLQHLPEFDGRVSAIAYGSQVMLEKLGVWKQLEAHAEPIMDIRVSDNQSPFFLHYNFEEVGTTPFGWIIENRFTRKALYDALLAYSNVVIYENEDVASLVADDSHATVTLGSGLEIKAKLVVAADGKFSTLRMLAGIHAHTTNYKQTAIVATIAHNKPHYGLAQERFLARGPFAVLPMTEQRSSLVWVEPERFAPHYLKLSNAEAAEEIQERVGDYLGDVSLVSPLFSYPLGLSVANAMTSKRVALIGDAAHAIHPIAGQGINLGFRDVAALHELIMAQATSGGDIGAATLLSDYERWRSMDVFSMALVTDGLNRLFSNNSKLLKIARGLGLYGVSHAKPIKQFFMKHAMGKTGELPKLMKSAS